MKKLWCFIVGHRVIGVRGSAEGELGEFEIRFCKRCGDFL